MEGGIGQDSCLPASLSLPAAAIKGRRQLASLAQDRHQPAKKVAFRRFMARRLENNNAAPTQRFRFVAATPDP